MTDKNFFNALTEWIDDHADEKISLDKVAKKSGYSKWHLNRMFTKHCGVSLGKYINNTRMQAASLSLRFTEATIAEVADQFNYASQQTFTRAFSRHFGMPPGIWRITDAAKKSDKDSLCFPSDDTIFRQRLRAYVMP